MTSETAIWLCPTRMFDGQRIRRDVALPVTNGRTGEVTPRGAIPGGVRVIELDGTLTPGFLDLQVNGGGGVLFNADPTPDGLKRIIAAHRQLGTSGVLATLITDSAEAMDRAVDTVLAEFGTPGLLGMHLEGPHISLARRGTHAARHVRPMEARTMDHVERLRQAGIPVLITVAPEAATNDEIARLADNGAVVSIGHTDADADTCKAAIAAGAHAFTHLFNAMSPMTSRAPGATGAAIASNAFAGIICDGIHVADDMLGIAIRGRPKKDRMFIVSDAMPTVGGPDQFALYGQQIRLEADRLVNSEGSLAGAHITMAESVKRLVSRVGISIEDAFRMAVTVPSEMMGLGLDRIEDRDVGDLVFLDVDLGLSASQPSGLIEPWRAAHSA